MSQTQFPMRPLRATLWQMLAVRLQRDPLSGEGARRLGGRWNAGGTPALYLATAPPTAVAEFNQGLPKPGTLAPYLLEATLIANLTDGTGRPCDANVKHACPAAWTAMAARAKPPPSWDLAATFIASGAQGALVPST